MITWRAYQTPSCNRPQICSPGLGGWTTSRIGPSCPWWNTYEIKFLLDIPKNGSSFFGGFELPFVPIVSWLSMKTPNLSFSFAFALHHSECLFHLFDSQLDFIKVCSTLEWRWSSPLELNDCLLLRFLRAGKKDGVKWLLLPFVPYQDPPLFALALTWFPGC